MIEFFIPCLPPTTTSQMKRMNRASGRFFKSKEGQAAEEFYMALLQEYAPATPVVGPLKLKVIVTWPHRKSEPKRNLDHEIPHTSKPDADNWIKQFQDVLVALRFIENDQSISDLAVSKRRGPSAGIEVRISRIEL